MKFGFVKSLFFPTLAYFDVGSIVVEYGPSEAISVLQGIFTSDHFGPKAKQQNCSMLVLGKNETKSCKWVAKMLLFSG